MKPVFIYDGECGFCKKCARRWKKRTGDRVVFRPFQEAAKDFDQITLDTFRASPHFIDENGQVFVAGQSIVELLARGRGLAWHKWVYIHIPFANRFVEYLYKKISSCRECADKITSVIWRD